MAGDPLSRTFAALADPTRRAILARLAEGEATVNELAAPFPITVQAISKHLKVLEQAGLIARGRTAQLRPPSLQGCAGGGSCPPEAARRSFAPRGSRALP
jgi:predicted ArsR family transcriptional regulator